MKTLYLTDNSENLVVDVEEDFVGKLPREDRYMVRNIYQITEPMHVVYQSGDIKQELNAKKGDILLQFYGTEKNPYTILTVKSKEWNKNINTKKELEQKAKEEWASKQSSCAECDCAECEEKRLTI